MCLGYLNTCTINNKYVVEKSRWCASCCIVSWPFLIQWVDFHFRDSANLTYNSSIYFPVYEVKNAVGRRATLFLSGLQGIWNIGTNTRDNIWIYLMEHREKSCGYTTKETQIYIGIPRREGQWGLGNDPPYSVIWMMEVKGQEHSRLLGLVVKRCLWLPISGKAERNQWFQRECKFTCKSSRQSDLHQLERRIHTLCSSI